MNMIRVSHHDLPNPAKRIDELESELRRVRAALDEARTSSATWKRCAKGWQKSSRDNGDELERVAKLTREARADRDALRARLQAVEAAARWACESWPARSESWIRADHEDAMEALTAALAESEMTK